MSSSLNFMGFYVNLLKFYGVFEIKTDSKLLKRLIICYIIGYQLIFISLGFILYTLSIFESSSSKETLQILFIVFAYLNAVFKSIISLVKRKKLQYLWSSLYDSDLVAKNQTEQK